MKTNLLCALVLSLVFSTVHAAPVRNGEKIVRDPVTGDYTAYYLEEPTHTVPSQAKFRTATRIDPTIRSMLKRSGWNIRYAYTVSNGKKAQQPICSVDFRGLPVEVQMPAASIVQPAGSPIAVELFETAMTSPDAQWSGSGVRVEDAFSFGWLCESWSEKLNKYDRSKGLQAGQTIQGFGVESTSLPGIFTAQLLGNTWPHRFDSSSEEPDSMVTDIARQMDEIVANDFIPAAAAAPMIFIPTPFNPAVVMDRIRAHVATWPGFVTTGYNGNVPANKKIFLLEPTFAAQLDRYLAAAADAFRRNQIKAAREHLETVHNLLEKEHKDLKNDEADERDETANKSRSISRLAARILDFDLNYVLQRTESPEAKNR